MARMSNRTARIVKWAALPAALIVSGVVVSQASYSAFTATTTNAANSWASGELTLTSTPATALFSVSNIKPGDFGSKCITVTAPKVVSGTTVTMAAATTAGGKAELNDQLAIKVTPSASCPTLPTTAINFAASTTMKNFITSSGVGPLPLATDGSSQKYLIEWVLNPGATSVEVPAGKASSVDFTWTATQGAGQQLPTTP